MKERVLAILLCAILFAACGGDSADGGQMENLQLEAVEDSIPTIEGQFIYLADAAVLKGNGFIYGVRIDSLALDLAEKVKPFKQENFDMVPVTVKAKIIQNPGTKSWDEFIEIREVLEVAAQHPDSNQKALEEQKKNP